MQINIQIDISRRALTLIAATLILVGAAAGNVVVDDPDPFKVKTELDMENNPIFNVDWTSSDDGPGSNLDADRLDGQQGNHYEDGALTNCGSGEILTGDGTCTTGTGGSQDLAQVLAQGNTARGYTAIVNRFYVDDHGAGGTPSISLAVGDSDTGLHSDTGGRLEFWSDNSEILAVEGSQLVMQGNSIRNPGEVQDSSGNTMVNFDDSNRDVEINDNTGFQLPVGTDAY